MKFEMEGQLRKAVGKGPARQIRRSGKIPAVLYGRGKSQPLILDPRVVRNVILSQAGGTGLISLKVLGDGEVKDQIAVIQDYQKDPITGVILHVDLFEVQMDQPIRVKVAVHIVGETPVGVKRDKGELHQILREVHVECLPGDIPDHLEVDASALEIGQGVQVKDLQTGEAIKVFDDAELMVVNVSAPMSEAVFAASIAGESGATEAAAPTAEDQGKAESASGSGKAEEGKK